MFTIQDFKASIDPLTLRFHKKSQENCYRKIKEMSTSNKLMLVLTIPIFGLMVLGMAITLIKKMSNNEYHLVAAGIVTAASGALGILAEWLAFRSEILKEYRGVFVNMGVYFCCAFYAVHFFDKPSLYPG